MDRQAAGPRALADGATDALRLIARAGYAARGVVYLIVGYFALLAAVNWGKVSGTRGALEAILGRPHGVALLGLAIAGLLGHAGWRLAQSLLDADHHGAGLKGLAVRAALFGSAILYLALIGIRGAGCGLDGGPEGFLV